MRIAHLIVAHKNPKQLERLISALNHQDSDCYIHLDKKVDIRSFDYLKQLSNVHFVEERIRCNWGGYSLVRAMLKSIEQIRKTKITYDFINLLSAQDYPVKPVNEIHDFFEKHIGKSFISFDISNDTKWWKAAAARYKKFHLTDMNFRGKYFIQNLLNKMMPERIFPLDLRLYGSSNSTWWTINYEVAIYMAEFLNNNSELTSFLNYTWTPDEFAIATLIMNSPYKNEVINNNYRYIEWNAGEAHPKTLLTNDYEKIIQSDMLFARKFDIDADPFILDKIDKHITD
ncbi:beta-1,6-N-acetylglucosaminyltransferase [Pedobacter sp. AW31-3R]|uniref:beta-1,6-N-acetylglucosaminyltransferase n=1 Tax=Pedobacter sp. AW31-3R TaxID=3445781 RepID=UPI003FA18143